MRSPKDDGFYGSYGTARRSTLGADSKISGLFRTGQGRLVLPPLSSISRYSGQHFENHFSISRPIQTTYSLVCLAPVQHSHQHLPALACHDLYGPRHGDLQYPSASVSRILAPSRASFTDEIYLPTRSYRSQYSPYQIPQQPSYYPERSSDTRNTHFPTASYNWLSHAPIGPQSPHPCSIATSQSAVYGAGAVAAPTEEPIIKKKRKRADPTQLLVLNAVYQRTPFPSTDEREWLAVQLDMPARSVQIWYVGILKVWCSSH
jgi:homeobox protein YOX1/YHP1